MSTPTSALFLLTQHIPEGGEGGVVYKNWAQVWAWENSWNSVWRGRGGGGGCLQVDAGVRVEKFLEFRLAEGGGCRCARGKIPGIPSGGEGGGEGEGLAPFGAGVSVGKFLEVTLNGARVGVRIAYVINIFLARDNNKFWHVKTCV